MAVIDDPTAARRLARTIASDVLLYNEQKIDQGIQNDNLFQLLAEEIQEGKDLFKARVSPELYATNLYGRALVDIVIRSKGHIQSKMW